MYSYHYRLYGLVIESALELPELRPIAAEAADITVTLQTDLAMRGYRLVVDDVATFEVEAGRSIRIRPVPGVDPRNIRLFLLGSAMGAALHQRGLFPLHANAVIVDGRAIAFTGPSGSGKSTIAAWFEDQSYTVLADDVCVIRVDPYIAISPGVPRLRLWRDALERSGRAADDFQASFLGTADERDKFDVPISTPMLEAPVPLRAILRLDDGPEFSAERLALTDAVAALVENTYRGHLVTEIGSPEDHFQTCVALARGVPVYDVRRPQALADPGHVARTVLASIE